MHFDACDRLVAQANDQDPTLRAQPNVGRGVGFGLGLALALAVFLAAEGWVIATAVAPAHDSRRFIAYAERIGTAPLLDVLRSEFDHPGYPLVLAGVFRIGRAIGLAAPYDLLLLARLFSVACGGTILILVCRTMRDFSNARVALAATFSLALLPRPLWVFADVLSDPLHALLWIAGALCAARGLERRQLRPFAGCAIFGALAYTVRVDALTLPAAVCGALLLCALLPGMRRSFGLGRLFAAGAIVLGGAALELTAFTAIYGQPSPKPSFEIFLSFVPSSASGFELGPARGTAVCAAVFYTDRPEVLRAFFESFSLLAQSLQFVHVGSFALASILTARRKSARPAAALFIAVVVVQWVAVALVGREVGYSDARYFLAIVPLAVGFGATSIRLFSPPENPVTSRARKLECSLGALLVCSSLAASAPSLAGRRLHDGSHGLIAAGRWVAAHAEPGATIYDPYFFPSWLEELSARRVAEVVPRATSRDKPHYVIAQEGDLKRLTAIRNAVESERGERVASFPRHEGSAELEVHVWRFIAPLE